MIGSLRHRVYLQKKSATRDSFGAETETWVTKATVWASIEPIYGQEYFEGKMENAEITHQIIIRYYSSLTPDWRIKFGSRIFNIYKVFNLEFENNYMEIEATEQIELTTIEWTGFLAWEDDGVILWEDGGKIELELHA